MTITYSIVPEPIWYFADGVGRPLSGGTMTTYSSLNPSILKPIYQDANGVNAWPNPVNIAINGTQGVGPAFFWKFDSNNLSDTYLVQVRDSSGNLVWQIDNFGPGAAGGGGGGGGSTTNLVTNNLVVNGAHFRPVGSPNVSINIIATQTFLAPSSHQGLSTPDINLIKNTIDATENVTFVPFAPGSDFTTPVDETPENALQFTCSVAGTETSKYIRYPLNWRVKTLENVPISFSIWAKGISGTQTLTVNIRQYMGQGGVPSADVVTSVQNINLTNGWVKYTTTATIPALPGGVVLGSAGDDATFLEIGLPLNQTCSMQYTKPSIYLGTFQPTSIDFEPYDKSESVFNSPRTGDIRSSMSPYLSGWVPLNNGTIGNASSGASTRANVDTFQLYSLIWFVLRAPSAQGFAPLYTAGPGGTTVAYGASALADFTANRQLSLTKQLGNVLAGTTPNAILETYTANTGISTTNLIVANAAYYGTGTPVALLNSGGAPPTGLSTGVIYYTVFIDGTHVALATSITNALANVLITFSTNGTGTNTIQSGGGFSGTNAGDATHLQTIAEMPAHDHTYSVVSGAGAIVQGGATFNIVTGNTGMTGGNTPFSIIQPTTYMNMFMKL